MSNFASWGSDLKDLCRRAFHTGRQFMNIEKIKKKNRLIRIDDFGTKEMNRDSD